MENENKVALVTGANQGVGFQIAKALAENGYTVYVGSRNLQNGVTAAQTIGYNARALQIDVTDKSSIEQAVALVQQESGTLDLLVNNAAISHAGAPGRTLEEIIANNQPSICSVDEMRTVWETNVFGVVMVTQAFLPLLRQANRPRIVNVSSGLASLTLARDPQNPFAPNFELIYGASKTALNAVTVAFANELEKSGITVRAVSPGFTATALNNFQGTDSLEEGSREPVRVALEEDGPTASFTGPDHQNYPW